MVNSAFAFKFWAAACVTTEADRVKSSYDELVHEPIKPTSIFIGHPFAAATSFILLIGVAKSGEKGPLI